MKQLYDNRAIIKKVSVIFRDKCPRKILTTNYLIICTDTFFGSGLEVSTIIHIMNKITKLDTPIITLPVICAVPFNLKKQTETLPQL
ncbi:hypothetical protein GCM10011351_00710 [Paraliobacillus quinghaiensis]|uniref:Uncharacterized protein n=1 Tax=Paraliobacillus quinghaiensis TaxID=470815 RepID=A0A917WPJ6_9BACI|nr:hypothetical protein GCM10011351_00710 [Paraliobacillus quinghaiensis]